MRVLVLGVSGLDITALIRAGAAVVPMTGLPATGLRGVLLATVRRLLFWIVALDRAEDARALLLIDAPRWARILIARRRRRAGLPPAVETRDVERAVREALYQ